MIKVVLGVWRHTCLSVDFQTGNLILVENGQLLKETVSEELTQMFQVFAFSHSLSKIAAVQDDCLIAAQHFDSPWCRRLTKQ